MFEATNKQKVSDGQTKTVSQVTVREVSVLARIDDNEEAERNRAQVKPPEKQIDNDDDNNNRRRRSSCYCC